MRKILSACLAAILSFSLGVPAVYAAEVSALPEGFSGLENKISAIYIYDDTQMIAYDALYRIGTPLGPNRGMKDVLGEYGVEYEDDHSYLTSLAPKQLTGGLGKQLAPIGSMDILLLDDTKYTYGFYENGVTVARGAPGKSMGKTVSYSVDKKVFQTLLKSVLDAAEVDAATIAKPTWLAVMRGSRATKLTVQAPKKTYVWASTHPNFSGTFNSMLRCFDIKPGSMRAVKYKKLPKTGTLVTIDFNSKVRYTIDVKPETITIYVNDRDYGLRYACVRDQTGNMESLVNNPNIKFPVDT